MAALVAPFGIALAEPAMPDSVVRVGACATPGIAWGVFVQGDYAYVADRGAVTVVDATDPSFPWVAGTLNDPLAWALGLFVENAVAYLNWTALGNGFSTLDVSNPDSLYVIGWCYVPPAGGPDPTGVCTVDTITYLANGDDGLGIINVSDPASPDTVTYFDTPGYALDLSTQDTLVFIADYDSLVIVNVADVLNPYRVGAVNMPDNCYGISVAGEYAYVACKGGFGFGSLEVVNVSDPSSPQIVASVDNIVGDPLDVWISGSYAYVAAADYPSIEGGVRVVDISDPLSPSLVASYDTPGDPRGVFAVGDLVFVADYDSLQILRHIATGINESTVEQQPRVLRLRQNQPNPFTDFTTVRYELPTAGSVTLEIYDVTGRLVRTLVDAAQPAGLHTAMWDGRDEANGKLASGVYFCRLTTESGTLSNKMLLVR